jgi:hypothetical protein
VDLKDAKGQELPCSGVITFGVELAGRTTSVTAWVSPALRNRIIVGSGTLQDLGFSTVEEIPKCIGSDGPIEETRTLGVPGLGSAVTRLSTQREDPLNLGRFAGKSAPGGVAKNLMSPFHMGWVREVVSRNAQPNKAEIYYISPDKRTKLRSSKDAVKYFLNYPHDNLSAENFSWKQKALGLNDPLFERLRTAKPQSPRRREVPLMKLPPPIFDDDPSPAFDINEVYHEQPGDIQEDSWGIVEKSEDVNANTRDFEAERKAYEHAKRLREGYENMRANENDERFHTGHV